MQLYPLPVHLLFDVEVLWHVLDDGRKVVISRTLA